ATAEAITQGMGACSRCGLWQQTLALLAQLKLRQLEPSGATYQEAIDACSDASDNGWRHSLALLQEMKDSSVPPDGQHFAGAVAAVYGRWQLALAAVVEMRQLRIGLAQQTYVDLLLSCKNAGLEALAVQILEEPLQAFADLDSG
ncbi:unnamed protein product, partial [Polarella glacialis]